MQIAAMKKTNPYPRKGSLLAPFPLAKKTMPEINFMILKFTVLNMLAFLRTSLV